jgi:hypothetical protein
MRAIIEKELREQARTLLGGFVGVMLMMSFGLVEWDPARPWSGVRDPRFQSFMLLASILLGLALGILQTLPEIRRGAWANLVHRPISRSQIFWGKAIAGIGSHALLIGGPFVVFALWTALQADAGPFTAKVLYPGIIDLLSGSMYWFAGALIGLRPVRFYGSRLLPLFAAVLVHFLLMQHPFVEAAVVTLLVTEILGLAAWGTFVGGGVLRAIPLPARFALGASAIVGLGCLSGILFATTSNVVASFTRPPFENQTELWPRRQRPPGYRDRSRDLTPSPIVIPSGESVLVSADEVASRGRTRAVWTTKRVLILEGEIVRFETPVDSALLASLATYPSRPDGGLAIRYDRRDDSSELVQYGADGQVLARTPAVNPREGARGRSSAMAVMSGTIVPPIVNAWTIHSVRRDALLPPPPSRFNVLIAVSIVQAIAGALASFLIARRQQLRGTTQALWLVTGAVFGVTGVLGAIAVLDFVATIPCTACGRRRLVDRDHCEHCGAAMPTPARDGTEIFEAPCAPLAALN